MAGPHRAEGPKKVSYLCFVATPSSRCRPAAFRPDPGHRTGPPLSLPPPRRSGGAPKTAAEGSVRIEVRVELKPGIVDAEAESIQKSLGLLGLRSIRSVATARVYALEFAGVAPGEAERLAREAVDRLLANPVIHQVTIRPVPG